MDIRLALMCGSDIPIPELQMAIHQPTLKEISYIGEEDFFMAIQCLQISKNMFIKDNSLLESTTNFQIFMMVMSEKETQDKKKAVVQLFELIFPGYKITFTPNSILFIKDGNSVFLDENNFDIFQECLKDIFCFNNSRMDQTSFNPADKKAQEIAEKLMRGRQRVAAQKGESNSSIFSQYLSTLAIGIPADIETLKNLTMYQLYDLVERYMLYINWDLDIKTRLAGGKPDSSPENWMKNIH